MATRRIDPWVIAAVVAGLALRLVNLGTAPFWLDEMYTFEMLRVPWDALLGAAMRDNQAPLYYVVTKGWTALGGWSTAALRAPGLLASLACIPLAAAVTRLVAGARAARMAAWVAALSPLLIQHAQDARPYALLAAVATANLLILVRFLVGRSPRLGFWWVASAFVVVATHYYGIFFLAGQGLALLILRPAPVRGWLPAGVVAAGLCGALVLTAVGRASGDFGARYVFGITAMPGVVWSLLTGYALMPTSEDLHALGGTRAMLPYLPVALPTLPAFALVAAAGLRTMRREGRVLLLAIFTVALCAPFAYRLAAGVGVHPRYFAAAIAPVVVVTGAGMVLDRSARGIATAVLLVIMSAATFLHLWDTTHGREDLRAAGRWLDANVPPDEEILVTSSEMEVLARFTWPGRKFRRYPDGRGLVDPARVRALVEAFPMADRARAIYLVGRAWVTDRDGALQAALVDAYPSCPGIDVRGIRIYCFRPRSTATANVAANR
ncbi:MAG: glycosyltransferase family 39 protein [Deltaproteobacteria bacterium]|nr:glycosyltransferase family 39 protein [Deltaproteobacteria bacterium]